VVPGRGEPGDCSAPELEGGHSVGGASLGIKQNRRNGAMKPTQRASIRLLDASQKAVDAPTGPDHQSDNAGPRAEVHHDVAILDSGGTRLAHRRLTLGCRGSGS
jgi:hypothetical protein